MTLEAIEVQGEGGAIAAAAARPRCARRLLPILSAWAVLIAPPPAASRSFAVGELEEVLYSLLKDDRGRRIIVEPGRGTKWQVVREVFVLAKHASRGGVWLKPSD